MSAADKVDKPPQQLVYVLTLQAISSIFATNNNCRSDALHACDICRCCNVAYAHQHKRNLQAAGGHPAVGWITAVGQNVQKTLADCFIHWSWLRVLRALLLMWPSPKVHYLLCKLGCLLICNCLFLLSSLCLGSLQCSSTSTEPFIRICSMKILQSSQHCATTLCSSETTCVLCWLQPSTSTSAAVQHDYSCRSPAYFAASCSSGVVN